MKLRTRILIAVLCLMIPGLLESLAADPEHAPSGNRDTQAELTRGTSPITGESLMALSEAQAERLSPLNREIRELLLQEMADVARLALRAKALQDPIAVLDLQRDISTLKAATQISILEAQGRFARQEGRIEQAAEIDAAVALMNSRQAARIAKREAR
jgi:hypothetical protein